MENIVLTVGQHRNEKAAQIIAPLLAKKLEKMGYGVALLNNPEKRTFRQIGFWAFRNGFRISVGESDYFLREWEWRMDEKYNSLLIFNLHDANQNAITQFETEKEHAEKMELFAKFSRFNVGRFRRSALAGKIFHFKNESGQGTTIEFPVIVKTEIPADELKKLKSVFTRRAFAHNWSYLFDTDIDASEKQGLLRDKTVEIAAYGIDRIVKSKQ